MRKFAWTCVKLALDEVVLDQHGEENVSFAELSREQIVKSALSYAHGSRRITRADIETALDEVHAATKRSS